MKILTKKNSVEIACPLTSIMEDEEEYEAKTPYDQVKLMHAISAPQPLIKTNSYKTLEVNQEIKVP